MKISVMIRKEGKVEESVEGCECSCGGGEA